jgi:hypothetical protein
METPKNLNWRVIRRKTYFSLLAVLGVPAVVWVAFSTVCIVHDVRQPDGFVSDELMSVIAKLDKGASVMSLAAEEKETLLELNSDYRRVFEGKHPSLQPEHPAFRYAILGQFELHTNPKYWHPTGMAFYKPWATFFTSLLALIPVILVFLIRQWLAWLIK